MLPDGTLADDEDAFDELFASERVGDLLTAACRFSASAATELAALVGASSAAAREAGAAGARGRLADALDDATLRGRPEAVLAALRGAIAACSEDSTPRAEASQPLLRRVRIPGSSFELEVEEQSSSHELLGGRLWPSALALASCLQENPRISALLTRATSSVAAASGQGPGAVAAADVSSSPRVLEVGAGACGLGGLAAFALSRGRARVTLSDAQPPLLEVLVRNAKRAQAAVAVSLPGSVSESLTGRIDVRALDWETDGGGGAGVPSAKHNDPGAQSKDVPLVDNDAVFDLILGADVLYERSAAAALGRLLSRRLIVPHGSALLVCPCRDASVVAAFVVAATQRGLRVASSPCSHAEDVGCGKDKYTSVVQLDIDWPPVDEAAMSLRNE